MTTTTFRVGDRVAVNPQAFAEGIAQEQLAGRTFVVTKVNPKRIVATATDGGRGINYPKTLLVHADGDTAAAATPTVTAEDPPTYRLPLDPGQVVTVRGLRWNRPEGELYVVLGDTRGETDSYRIARLGGAGGRYYPRIPRAMLTVVDPACITVKEDTP